VRLGSGYSGLTWHDGPRHGPSPHPVGRHDTTGWELGPGWPYMKFSGPHPGPGLGPGRAARMAIYTWYFTELLSSLLLEFRFHIGIVWGLFLGLVGPL
jgi:hypothetical protein